MTEGSAQFVAVGVNLFQARFPFSWLVKQKIDEILAHKASITGTLKHCSSPVDKALLKLSGATNDVETLFIDTAIGTRLAAFLDEDGLVDAYGHDYVRMVYKPQSAHPTEEYQVRE